MSHLTDAESGLPPGRYGEPRKLPRWATALLIVGGALALVPVALAVIDRATPGTRAAVTGFEIIDANRVTVMVDVTKPADRTATCTVQARNFYSDVVGSSQVIVRGATQNIVVEKTFPTSDRAVIVEVTECLTTAAS